MSPSVVYNVHEGRKFEGDTTLVVVSCSTCRITYAIPKSLYDSALKWRGDRPDGRGWKICCPMGHTWWYVGESEEDRLRRLLKETARQVTAERDLREHTEHKLRAQKGATTKARKRHAAALCPCCNRSFVQLARHLETKHPDYDPTT